MKAPLASSLTLLFVATGIALAAFVGDPVVSPDASTLLFLGFAGAVVAVQLIPSYLMLRRIVGSLLKNGKQSLKQTSQ